MALIYYDRVHWFSPLFKITCLVLYNLKNIGGYKRARQEKERQKIHTQREEKREDIRLHLQLKDDWRQWHHLLFIDRTYTHTHTHTKKKFLVLSFALGSASEYPMEKKDFPCAWPSSIFFGEAFFTLSWEKNLLKINWRLGGRVTNMYLRGKHFYFFLFLWVTESIRTPFPAWPITKKK